MAITWNPADKHAEITLSNGDLTATDTLDTNYSLVRTTETIPAASKKYWEVTVDAIITSLAWGFCIGVANSSEDLTSWVGKNVSWAYHHNGYKAYSGSKTAFGSSYSAGDVISIAVDENTHEIWFAKNGIWQASGDPANGSNPAFTMDADSHYLAWSGQKNGDQATANFGATSFVYSPPDGFFPFDISAKLFDGKIRIKNSVSNLLDGKAKIDVFAPSFFDGKADVKDFATDLFYGKAEVTGWKADLLDGKAEVTGWKADLLDGKARLTAPATSLFNGKVLVCLKTTNLLDGKVELHSETTNFLDGKSLIKFGEVFDFLDGKAAIQGAAPDFLDGKCLVQSPAKIDATVPAPTANFTIGKKIIGNCPIPGFTCTAYSGRNPSIIASLPVPICSMRVGLNLNVEAGVQVPTCSMVADTHHLATLYGNIPTPTCEIVVSTENVAIISAISPCPRGLFVATVGNVADIHGRVSCPTCSMRAFTGIVVSLRGAVPVPGSLVRFYASPANVSITLEGDMPVPIMASSVFCSIPSLILKHVRGKNR